MNDFAIFILSHGRADRVLTVKTLEACGYTGMWYVVIDDEDSQGWKYKEKFGDRVIMFNKAESAEHSDTCDNFHYMNIVLYARNACFDIAKSLQLRYFLVLDDDYGDFWYRYDTALQPINNLRSMHLDKVISAALEYYKSIPALSIAFAQAGDFLGGKNGGAAHRPIWRKCMNSFFMSTDRPFKFLGTINEDVNAYCLLGSQGYLFLNIPLISVGQQVTQSKAGGLTEAYLSTGTYVKSFYTAMLCPSSVTVELMHSHHPRLHHKIKWATAVPKIIHEKWRKTA